MKTIHKHILTKLDQVVRMQKRATVIHVAPVTTPEHGHAIQVWVECDFDPIHFTERRFQVFNTGELQPDLDRQSTRAYIGTCLFSNGIVQHLYEVIGVI